MPKARVSGLGVVPGVSSQEAAHVIAGECAEAPFVPLLPSRGPGADPIGRTGAIIALISSDFAIETVPTGWRLTSVPGRDISRGQGFLSSDLDAMEEQFHQADSTLTISITGPVTWAASVEDPRGEKLIRDHGALREVTSALTNSIAELLEQLRRRFPSIELFVQIDEPLVMSAVTGAIPTASSLHTYVALDPQRLIGLWEPMFTTIGASGSRYGINASGGSAPLSDQLITSLLASGTSRFYQVAESGLLGEVMESGREIMWLCNPAWSGNRSAQDIVARVTSLGFAVDKAADNALVTPSPMEMSGDWGIARNALTQARAAVDLLNDPDRLSTR